MEQIPIFVVTRLAGQGQIFNERWIQARLKFFHAVTYPSLTKSMDEGVYWILLVGESPSKQVSDYIEEHLAYIPNIHIIYQDNDSKLITKFAKKHSHSERYLTCRIDDDDAWPVGHFETVRKYANDLINKGDEHCGFCFTNGYEWVVSDIVDQGLKKKGYDVIIPEMVIEFRKPWLAHSLFILQTKTRPFTSFGAAHSAIPEKLKQEDFKIIELDEPSASWLYARHQMVDSSLVLSPNLPIDINLYELENLFGIDAKLITEWNSGPFANIYCERQAHRKGDLELYEYSNTDGYFVMPYKSLIQGNDGYYRFHPKNDMRMHGKCKLQLWNNDVPSAKMTFIFNADTFGEFVLTSEPLIGFEPNRFTIDIQKDNRWRKAIPPIKLKGIEL